MKNQKGQGLIEAIVAIGIMITGIVGAISLINFLIQTSTGSTNRFIAINLASEAIEIITNIRDSNYLAGDPYDTLLSGDGTAIAVFDPDTNVWNIDFSVNSITEEAARLYQVGGVYIQDQSPPGGQPTIFRRMINFTYISDEQINVQVVIEWSERGNTKTVQIDREFYDWR